jgi:hypothetical protein
MKRSLLITIWIITMLHNASAQSKMVFENYNYWGHQTPAIFVPMIHIETKNNWYAEMRYNYEEAETISIYAGKTFGGDNALHYHITPMAGFSAGRFTGVSFATNAEVNWKKIYFSSQSQYSRSFKKEIPDFFFSWSEAGYNVFRIFFAGLAVQYTRQQGVNDIQPGFVAGLNFKNISIPFYLFSPFQPGRYIVLGFNYEYNLKKKE